MAWRSSFLSSVGQPVAENMAIKMCWALHQVRARCGLCPPRLRDAAGKAASRKRPKRPKIKSGFFGIQTVQKQKKGSYQSISDIVTL